MIESLLRARRALDVLNLVASALAACGVIFACCAVTWAVLGRGLVGMNTIWELEASVYLLIYAAFLSLAYSDRAGGQIAIELVRKRFSGRAKRMHRGVLDLMALALFILLFISSWEMFIKAWDSGWRSASLWGPPLWMPYLAIPIGTALMIPNLLLDILIRLCGHDAPADAVTGEH